MSGKTKSRGNGQGTVFKRGASWTACVAVCEPNQPRRTKTKGGFTTKRDALAALPDLRKQLLGFYRPSDTITFAKLYDRWYPYYEPRVGQSTMNGHEAAYKWFSAIHGRIFTTITAEDLQRCVDACTRGKRTKENMRSLAHQLYKYAGSIQITDKNFAQYIFCGNDAEGTIAPLENQEIELVRRAVGIIPYADYAYCLSYLGFRPNEFFSLKKSDYDPIRKTLIGGSKTDAGKNRIVVVSSKIIDIVEFYCSEPDDYLFPDADGTKMKVDYFRKYCFYPLMESLEIVGRKPYSARHSFSNMLKNAAGSDTDKAKLMGHTNYSMTKTYQSADYDSLKNIVDQF